MNDVGQIRAYYRAVLPYYDATLRDRGDLPFWDSIARRWSPTRILELGCGTGRVTEVLSQHAPVTAVDLLIEMLRRASRRAPRATLAVTDLRRFAFATRFDLVVLADDPMAHVTSTEERTNVMKLIADHLSPGGRVVLEGLYRPPGRPMRVPSRDVVGEGGERFSVEERWESAGDSMWKATYRYTEGSSITDATSLLRSWARDEVDRLPSAGLEIERLWGDFDERPFGDASPRLVLVARRAT